MNHAGMARPTPWLWMLLATCAVTLVTLVVFGALGGLMLLVGLFAVAALFNWLIARRRYAARRWPLSS
jgi:Flp pilus assembly protein TadB